MFCQSIFEYIPLSVRNKAALLGVLQTNSITEKAGPACQLASNPRAFLAEAALMYAI
jgi:hypothetical protein